MLDFRIVISLGQERVIIRTGYGGVPWRVRSILFLDLVVVTQNSFYTEVCSCVLMIYVLFFVHRILQ